MPMSRFILSFGILALIAWATLSGQGNLTGNWMANHPNPDGSPRRTYLNLKQEGPEITGTIRTTQFFFKIVKSTGDASGLHTDLCDGRRTEHADGRVPRQVGGR